MPQTQRISDGQALELMRALRLAIEALKDWPAGNTPGPDVISAASEFARCLSSIAPRQEAGRRNAGRKPVHDAEWARGILLDMVANDPDGIPSNQTIMINRLRAAFQRRGGTTPPGLSWLKETVSAFYAAARIKDAAAREKYRKSPDLQAVFEAESDFIIFSRAADRLEEKWWRDENLRRRHPTAADYIETTMSSR